MGQREIFLAVAGVGFGVATVGVVILGLEATGHGESSFRNDESGTSGMMTPVATARPDGTLMFDVGLASATPMPGDDRSTPTLMGAGTPSGGETLAEPSPTPNGASAPPEFSVSSDKVQHVPESIADAMANSQECPNPLVDPDKFAECWAGVQKAVEGKGGEMVWTKRNGDGSFMRFNFKVEGDGVLGSVWWRTSGSGRPGVSAGPIVVGEVVRNGGQLELWMTCELADEDVLGPLSSLVDGESVDVQMVNDPAAVEAFWSTAGKVVVSDLLELRDKGGVKLQVVFIVRPGGVLT